MYHSVRQSIKNVKLIHECSPKRLRMGTARMKYDKDTEEADKKRRMVWKEVKWAQNKGYDGLLSKRRSYRPQGSTLSEAVNELPN